MSKRRYYYKRLAAKKVFTREELFIIHLVEDIIKAIFIIVSGTAKAIFRTVKFAIKVMENNKFLKQTGYGYEDMMKIIYKMTPRQFEIFCAELYKALGHKAVLTPPGNDYGRDIIVDDVIFIECKHWKKDTGFQIGREICQKLLGSVQMFNATKGIIITTGQYNENAYECARMVDNLELLSTNDLLDMIVSVEPSKLQKVLIKTLNAA